MGTVSFCMALGIVCVLMVIELYKAFVIRKNKRLIESVMCVIPTSIRRIEYMARGSIAEDDVTESLIEIMNLYLELKDDVLKIDLLDEYRVAVFVARATMLYGCLCGEELRFSIFSKDM